MKSRIQLVYFEGCPNADRARDHLREALHVEGLGPEWEEWDLMAPDTPESFRRYGSPTVLVDGRDVTGAGGGAAAMSCRADGVPSAQLIATSLRGGGRATD
ncbi:MAG: hypothetical protein RH859_02835 [Longimicrobiales bacterium]